MPCCCRGSGPGLAYNDLAVAEELAQRCRSCSSLNISSAWFTRGNHIASAAGGLSVALQTHRPNTIELILFSVHDYVHCWKTSRELFRCSINN